MPVSVSEPAIRLVLEENLRVSHLKGMPMKYALVIYNCLADDGTPPPRRPEVLAPINALLARPEVTAWQRLTDTDSATTVKTVDDSTLFVDGPFIDSKEYLGGIIVVEADNLDGALAIAKELQEARASSVGAIEVRPILEEG